MNRSEVMLYLLILVFGIPIGYIIGLMLWLRFYTCAWCGHRKDKHHVDNVTMSPDAIIVCDCCDHDDYLSR